MTPPPAPLDPAVRAYVLITFERWWRRQNIETPASVDQAGFRDMVLDLSGRFGAAAYAEVRAELVRIDSGGTDGHTVQCPDCPVCGQPSRIMASLEQVICDTEDCRVLMWNATRTAADQAADEHAVNLSTLTGLSTAAAEAFLDAADRQAAARQQIREALLARDMDVASRILLRVNQEWGPTVAQLLADEEMAGLPPEVTAWWHETCPPCTVPAHTDN